VPNEICTRPRCVFDNFNAAYAIHRHFTRAQNGSFILCRRCARNSNIKYRIRMPFRARIANLIECVICTAVQTHPSQRDDLRSSGRLCCWSNNNNNNTFVSIVYYYYCAFHSRYRLGVGVEIPIHWRMCILQFVLVSRQHVGAEGHCAAWLPGPDLHCVCSNNVLVYKSVFVCTIELHFRGTRRLCTGAV